MITPADSARYPLASPTPSGSPVWDATQFSLTGAVPFLPDPLQKGGTLFIVDGALAGNTVPFDSPPEEARVAEIRAVRTDAVRRGSSAAANVDATARNINFALTPGDTFQVQLSSTIAARDLVKFGLTYWICEFLQGQRPRGTWRAESCRA